MNSECAMPGSQTLDQSSQPEMRAFTLQRSRALLLGDTDAIVFDPDLDALRLELEPDSDALGAAMAARVEECFARNSIQGGLDGGREWSLYSGMPHLDCRGVQRCILVRQRANRCL